jgi:NAD(P)-dependent dehydrogenase (short-subunit alcohol dehydrogenase family)
MHDGVIESRFLDVFAHGFGCEVYTTCIGIQLTLRISRYKFKPGTIPYTTSLHLLKMSHLFQDKVIAITGAASGIALETAKLLSSRGAKLSLADVCPEGLEGACSLIKSTGGTAISTTLDVRDRAAVESWIAATVAEYGRLDGAVNLAGVPSRQCMRTTVATLEDEDFDRVMDINVKGTLNCLRAELGVLERGGAVVNAASVFGLRGMMKNTAYVVSKHAIVGLTSSAAAENAHRGVRVNAVAP